MAVTRQQTAEPRVPDSRGSMDRYFHADSRVQFSFLSTDIVYRQIFYTDKYFQRQIFSRWFRPILISVDRYFQQINILYWYIFSVEIYILQTYIFAHNIFQRQIFSRWFPPPILVSVDRYFLQTDICKLIPFGSHFHQEIFSQLFHLGFHWLFKNYQWAHNSKINLNQRCLLIIS